MTLERLNSKRQRVTPMVLEGGKPYDLDSGFTVKVKVAEFKPKHERAVFPETSSDNAVVVMPGWGNTRLVTMQVLSQSFADSAKSKAFLLTTRVEERSKRFADQQPDFLYEEARAVYKFIKERGIKRVTLAGHSMAADRVIDAASILQNDPNIEIQGLILMGPMGVYEQGPFELAGKFVAHTGYEIPAEVKKKGSERDKATMKEGTWDGLLTHLEEIGRSWGIGPAYLRRLASEIRDMAKKNPRVQEIRAPIVLIVGTRDKVSSRERIVSQLEEEKVRKEMGEGAGSRKDLAARERILQKNLFTSSPYIRMIVPEKMGNHLVQIFRPESVAKVSTYLLERYERVRKAAGGA